LNLNPKPLHDHGDGFFTWHAYDPSCKAELWSTAYLNPEGTILFDPIEWPKDTPLPKSPVQIVKTNSNHDRMAETLQNSLQGRLAEKVQGFQAIPLPGAGENETAYFHHNSRSLIIGDALINLSPDPLMLLPAKYCTNSDLLQNSLKRLLALPTQRIFFAHGAPILQDVVDRLKTVIS
jgi:glyoxylase-like metal-dependent hydrolase (beta-lactamase superfamily II)